MDPNTEIRKLRPAELYTLSRILAVSDSWKTLMAIVPKEGNENEPKFNTEHFALIEQASCQQRKSGAEIFLEEWGTMGKRRPTLKFTLDLLIKVQLFRAADYIAVDLLKRPPPERPTSGPAAPIDISDEEIAKLLEQKGSEFEITDSQLLGSKESLDSVLDGLDYPSQLSVQSSVDPHRQEMKYQPAVNDCHERQRIGLEFIDAISTLRIDPEEINENHSDLMKFSTSVIEEPQQNDYQNPSHWNKSNLIQFSRNNNCSTNTIDLNENPDLRNGVCNTNLGDNAQIFLRRENIICTISSNNDNESESKEIIQKKYIGVQESSKNQASAVGYLGASAVSNSNNYNEFELQSCELPACIAEIGRGPTSTYSEVKSCELPQFVVDITRQRSLNKSDTAAKIESFGEPILSKDSTSSESSSDISTNVTSRSYDNAVSNIPIYVNYPSENLQNNELLSTELPQFVADLGHRSNNDRSSKTIDGTSEVSDNTSFNEQFQYLGLNSQELPLVISECNKMRSQLEENQRELQSTELPQFVAELQNVIRK